MDEYFPDIPEIEYEGPESDNPFAFKHYDPSETLLGKSMKAHLRFAVCFWHTFQATGADPFGPGVQDRPWLKANDPMRRAEDTMRAAFEFFYKLGVPFWCFHDRDIAPEGDSLAETNSRLDEIADLARNLQNQTGVTPLWGTTNAFSHKRFMAGAATNPSPHVFAYAASQVKKAMEITMQLDGAGYVLWGGREGYDTLLNTDMERELDHLGRFLHMVADYKWEIGFQGQLYIEPKPREPTKHQYDFDAAACYAFLQKFELHETFKLNIEANHATLAGHSFHHELAYAVANNLLGSVDANRGDLLLGWDTDQFPTDLYDTTLAMWIILKGGGFKTGGLNFDAKTRRQSLDTADLFHAHIGAMDAYARGLKAAARIIVDGDFEAFLAERYRGWDSDLGRKIESGEIGFKGLEAYTLQHGEPETQSGCQEMLENWLNEYI